MYYKSTSMNNLETFVILIIANGYERQIHLSGTACERRLCFDYINLSALALLKSHNQKGISKSVPSMMDVSVLILWSVSIKYLEIWHVCLCNNAKRWILSVHHRCSNYNVPAGLQFWLLFRQLLYIYNCYFYWSISCLLTSIYVNYIFFSHFHNLFGAWIVMSFY